MTIRPPTFDECEALAMLCDRLADRATGYGKTARRSQRCPSLLPRGRGAQPHH